MKSNKQRRLEIKTRRQRKSGTSGDGTFDPRNFRPGSCVTADHAKLAHNSYYCELPIFYVDKTFNCRACGSQNTWSAKKQKWWYEIAKGRIESIAIYCRDCRIKRRKEKEVQKTRMAELAKRKPHPNEAFFKKIYS